MIAAVADTHAAVWLLYGDPRLSPTAKAFIEATAKVGRKIVLSPISLAEVIYLAEKKRLPPSAFEGLQQCLKDPRHVLEEAPLTAEVMGAMRQVSRADVPDMPDRIVAATAAYLGVPIISRDGLIRASSIQTIW